MDGSSEIAGNGTSLTVSPWRTRWHAAKRPLKAALVIAAVLALIVSVNTSHYLAAASKAVLDFLTCVGAANFFQVPGLAAYDLTVLLGLAVVWRVARWGGALSEYSLLASLGWRRELVVACISGITAVIVGGRLLWLGVFDPRAASNELLVAAMEEFAFRYLVFGVLEGRRGWNGLIAVMLSSLLFGAMHLLVNHYFGTYGFERVLRQSVSAAGSGLILATIRLAFGSAWPGIFIHAVFNLPSEVPDETGMMEVMGRVTDIPFMPNYQLVCIVVPGLFIAVISALARQIIQRGLDSQQATDAGELINAAGATPDAQIEMSSDEHRG